MFERFTEPARQVAFHAQAGARRFGRDQIGSEHVVFGLLREERGLGCRVLQSLDIDSERIAARLGEAPWGGQRIIVGALDFTPRAKCALECARREAGALDCETISTHHLLLGLLDVSDCGAVRLLVELGARPPQIRQQLLAKLGAAPEEWPTSMQQLADFRSKRRG